MERILDFIAHGIHIDIEPTFRPFSSCAKRVPQPAIENVQVVLDAFFSPRYKNKRAERDLNCIDDHKR